MAQQLVNRGRVPTALAEPFVSGVNALREQLPACLPPAPVTIEPPPRHGHNGGDHHGDEGGD